MKKLILTINFILSMTFTFAQNIAPQATASASTCNTGACSTLNDLNFGTCGTQQMWISTATPPDPTVGVNWIQWDWSSPKAVDRFTIHHAQNTGRFLTGFLVQNWTGTSWVTIASISNLPMQCINTVNLPSVVLTQRIRWTSFLMQGTGQLSNPNFREIEIFGPQYYNDAGISNVTDLLQCRDTQAISATVTNFGLRRLDSLRLHWSINNQFVETRYINTSLTTGQSTSITLNPTYVFNNFTEYSIKVWATRPNGQLLDSGTTNDLFDRQFMYLGNPNNPTINNVTQCGQGNAKLIGIPDKNYDSIIWHSAPTGGTYLGLGRNTGGPYITSGTHTYYGQSIRISDKLSKIGHSGSASIGATQNNHYGGFLNITINSPIFLDSLLMRVNYNVNNTHYEIYYKTGTFAGFQTNPSAWTLVNEGTGTYFTIGTTYFARLSAKRLFLPAGNYAFYITTNVDKSTGNSLFNTFASATFGNSDISIQNNGSAVIGRFNTIITTNANYMTDAQFIYRKTCLNVNRLPIEVTVKPSPIGAGVIQGTPFNGKWQDGTKTFPDVLEVGKTVNYELTPPTGYSNAGHGTTWVINNVMARTSSGIVVPSNLYSVSIPTTSSNAILTYTPTSAYLDSFITFFTNFSDLGPHFCDSTVQRTVVIAPTPNVDFSFPTVSCAGEDIEFINLTTIHSGFVTYEWDFDDGNTSDFTNPYQNYAVGGCYNVTLKATSTRWGVVNQITKQVCVGVLPDINITVNNACIGNSIVFTNNSSISSGSIASFKWDFGDNTNQTTTNNTAVQKSYTNPGKYEVTIKATSNVGCVSTLKRNAYQFHLPSASFGVLNGTCSNDEFDFLNLSTITEGTMGYHWDFADNNNFSSEINASYTFSSAGTKNVKLKAISEFGCSDSITMPVNVLQAPLTDFNYDLACELKPTIFTNTTDLKGQNLHSYSWNFGNGQTSTITNPTVSWNAVGPKTVTLKTQLFNGCKSEVTKMLEVKFQPTADFDFQTLCQGEEIHFENKTTFRFGTIEYDWDFGGGFSSTNSKPKHTFANSGNNPVKLKASIVGGCSDSIIKNVSVLANPSTCDFDIVKDYTNNAYTFVFTPKGGSMAGTTYKWLFGDGSQNTSNASGISYSYLDGGNRYCVTMTATSNNECGCSSTRCIEVNTSVLNQTIKSFAVYPNPNNGEFQIILEGDAFGNKLEVFDLNGKLVKSYNMDEHANIISLNLRDLTSGVYMIQINTDNGILTQKVVIE